MKAMILILLLAIFALPLYAQNITNTLGAGGVFTIKDASNNYLTVSQSDGLLSLNKNLSLFHTTSSSLGVITKGEDSFIHDFAPFGAYGYNTFVGINSGNFTMEGTGNESCNNTGIGYSSLTSLTTGRDNTAVGDKSLFCNTTGVENTAMGGYSLFRNTMGYDNTAVGYASLYHNTTGEYNTAMGYASLYSNTTGYQNTALGDSSLYSNTTGYYNTAVGQSSLHTNTTGVYNTAFGQSSLYTNTTGYQNTAVGHASLSLNTTGYCNTAVGLLSIYTNTTGADNTAVGWLSLYDNTTGNGNTAVGVSSLFHNTTGHGNTTVGNNAGSIITTGSFNTLIGNNAQPSAATVSNEITLGNSSVATLRCQQTSITALSDARDKKNINDLSLGIDFLMKLKPRLFNWDKREWYKNNKSDGSKMQKTPTAGFIAQELDEVQIKENAEWLNLVLKSNPDKLEATPGNLLPVMVKAIQELEEKLLKYEQTQNELVTEINKLKSLKEN